MTTTSASGAARHIFDRPELLDSQTRLILSADAKPRRLIRSAARSAGLAATRDRSNSAASSAAIEEIDDEPFDDHLHDDLSHYRQPSIIPADVNYDTDIEADAEPAKDYSSKGLYLDQCRRHEIIPSSYFLKHLERDTMAIRYCALKPINVKVMVPALKINTTITRLDLRDNGLGSRGAIYISQLIKDNEFISELNLADNDIGLQGCKALCEVLRSNRTIRRLHLDGNRFDDNCASDFAELFSQNDYIQYVNLNKNHFENDVTGRLLGQALGENQTIEEFHLAWNHLRSRACAALLKPLANNARLHVLDLSWNGAGLATAKVLMDVLRKNSALEKLFLNHNQFNTEGATYIGKGLTKNETLKVLTLQGNPLESSGCYAVLRPLIKHPACALETVDFRGIIVNRDFLDLLTDLAAALPQLKVILANETEIRPRIKTTKSS